MWQLLFKTMYLTNCRNWLSVRKILLWKYNFSDFTDVRSNRIMQNKVMLNKMKICINRKNEKHKLIVIILIPYVKASTHYLNSFMQTVKILQFPCTDLINVLEIISTSFNPGSHGIYV